MFTPETWGCMIQFDDRIFFKGVSWNHQPDSVFDDWKNRWSCGRYQWKRVKRVFFWKNSPPLKWCWMSFFGFWEMSRLFFWEIYRWRWDILFHLAKMDVLFFFLLGGSFPERTSRKSGYIMLSDCMLYFWSTPHPVTDMKWRFIGIPYWKWKKPGGDCYCMGGRSKLY